MKHRTIIIAALAAVSILGVAGVAFAAPWIPRIGGLGRAVKEGTTFTPPAEALDLTDEQIARIQQIQQEAASKVQAIASQLMAEQAELRSLLWQRNVDQGVLAAKHEEIADLKQQITDITVKAKEDFLAVLTPEQQAKVNEIRGMGGFRGRLGKRVSPTVRKGIKSPVRGL